jgi:hypothetical protein
MALGVSRSNVLTKQTRSSEWVDLRKSPPRAEDTDLNQAIACIVKDRATYGYRRIWVWLKIDGLRIERRHHLSVSEPNRLGTVNACNRICV